MSRRYATYLADGPVWRNFGRTVEIFQTCHVLSSVGAFLQMAAMLLIAGCFIHSLCRGRRAPANPWGGSTLEWACSSPPPHDNFASPPQVGEPYDHSGLVWNEAIGGYERRKKKLV
jgi:cytochrome c oxidase subunit 1